MNYRRLTDYLQIDRRTVIVAAVFSFFFGQSCSLGLLTEGESFMRCVLQGLIVAVPIFIAFIGIASLLKCFDKRKSHAALSPAASAAKDKPSKALLKRVFLATFFILLALWTLVLFGVFPGFYSTDSNDILKMVLGLPFEGPHFRYDGLNNHHPFAYTAFVWVFMNIGDLVGLSEINCVGLVAFAQLALFAACFSVANMKLFELSRSNTLLAISSSFYLFNPLLAIYSVTLWKDILFTGAFLVFVIQFAYLMLNREEFWGNKSNVVLLFVSGLASMLLRSNGLLAIAFSLAVAVMVSKPKKRLALLAVCIIIPAVLIVSPLYHLIGVQPARYSEAIGVPLQQVSRTIIYGDLNSEQKAFFEQIMPLEEWADHYTETKSNGVKYAVAFDDEFLESHKAEFFSHWITMGLTNKRIYLEAWIAETKTFWSIDCDTWYLAAPGYQLVDDDPAVYENRLNELMDYSFVTSLFSTQKALTPLLFNVAALCWFLMLAFAMRISRGSKILHSGAWCLTPLIALWATYLLAAPAGDYRYVLPLFASLPFMLYVLVDKRASCTDGRNELAD